MGTITYTAVDRGRLSAGHSEGTQYTLEVDFERHDPSEDDITSESASLSGRRLTVFYRFDQSADLTTVFIDDTTLQSQIVEFFDSIRAGEQFVIDPYGTIAAPVEQITAIKNGPATKTRYRHLEVWKYSFSIWKI